MPCLEGFLPLRAMLLRGGNARRGPFILDVISKGFQKFETNIRVPVAKIVGQDGIAVIEAAIMPMRCGFIAMKAGFFAVGDGFHAFNHN